MSSRDRAKKRQARQARKAYAKPSLPRMIGANDNHANDNAELVVFTQEPGVKETPGQRIFRQMLRRALDERPLPARSYDPARLTPDQEKQLRRAEDRLKSDDPRRVAAAREEIEKLAESVRARIEAHERAAEKEETRKLEALRGSVIAKPGRNEPPDRIRIASRDGLETLLTAGSITRTQHIAGTLYRRDYEMIDPERGLTPPALDQTRSLARGGEGFAQRKAERERFVRDLEAMIQSEDRTFRGALGRSDVERIGRAVWALREIAGKGSNLRSLTASGSVIAATSEALQLALDCAAIAYGLK